MSPSAPVVGALPTPDAMRLALGQFATGVTVLTAPTLDGRPAGCTVSAFASVSLDPPLVLACIDCGRWMHGLLTKGPGFAVNVLGADQREVALTFARPGADRFAGLGLRPGRHGAPLLDGAIAHIECDRHAVLDGGDHSIVVGRVRGLATAAGEPLLYAQGRFLDVPGPAWDQALAEAARDVGANRWLLSAPW